MKKNIILGVMVVLGGIWGLQGCTGSSPRSSYYVFKTMTSYDNDVFPLEERQLGLGPITIPEYLNRPQIVTRQGDNRLSIREFHRWADSLGDQITGTLVENLSGMLNANVMTYPWERPFAPERQLYVDIRRFEGTPSGTVHLEAVWSLVDPEKDLRIFTQRSSIAVPVPGNDTRSYVMAMNSALEILGRQMAETIVSGWQ